MRAEQPEVFQALAADAWKVKREELEKLRTETSEGWTGGMMPAGQQRTGQRRR